MSKPKAEQLRELSSVFEPNSELSQCNQSMCTKQKEKEKDQESNKSQSNAEGSEGALMESNTETSTTDQPEPGAGVAKKPSNTLKDDKKEKDKKQKEKEKSRLAADALRLSISGRDYSNTLCNGDGQEPTFKLRKPGESKIKYRKALPPKAAKDYDMAPLGNKRLEIMEDHPLHLPFYKHNHYDRIKIVRKIVTISKLRQLINHGYYYIEKDNQYYIDPRLPTHDYEKRKRKIDMMRKNFKSSGRYNRICSLFFSKIMNYMPLKELPLKKNSTDSGVLGFLYLGKNLARSALMEICAPKPPVSLFQEVHFRSEKPNMYMINRLPNDTIFQDKEVLYQFLTPWMHKINQKCNYSNFAGEKVCENPSISNSICAHQNLSLCLKPCNVDKCHNYQKPLCPHLTTFLPETVVFVNHTSRLVFTERFLSPHDLGGTIFVVKPAYLENGRGMKFLTNVDQFKEYFHCTDMKSSRHGNVAQRYIENPLLFRGKKTTLRFFMIIMVLPKRRVVAFYHQGIVMCAKEDYVPITREEAEEEEEQDAEGEGEEGGEKKKTRLGNVTTEEFKPEVHITNYYDQEKLKQVKRDIKAGEAQRLPKEEDNVFYTQYVIDPESSASKHITEQMKYVGQCMIEHLESSIVGYVGTHQLVSIDCIVDTNYKLWVLEAGAKVFSGMLSIAPRQRQIMSAILQESFGVIVEVFFKAHNNLPLHYNYGEKKDDIKGGFYFAQDFEFFYETEFVKTDDYCMVQPPKGQELPLEVRYDVVDAQRREVELQRKRDKRRKQALILARREYKNKLKAKREEDS